MIDTIAVTMATPAEGPSFGVAPSGTWTWMSFFSNSGGSILIDASNSAPASLLRPSSDKASPRACGAYAAAIDWSIDQIDKSVQPTEQQRTALTDVRAQVIEAREKRRAVMLERVGKVNTEKLSRRLREVGSVLATPTSGHAWRAARAISASLKPRSRIT